MTTPSILRCSTAKNSRTIWSCSATSKPMAVSPRSMRRAFSVCDNGPSRRWRRFSGTLGWASRRRSMLESVVAASGSDDTQSYVPRDVAIVSEKIRDAISPSSMSSGLWSIAGTARRPRTCYRWSSCGRRATICRHLPSCATVACQRDQRPEPLRRAGVRIPRQRASPPGNQRHS